MKYQFEKKDKKCVIFDFILPFFHVFHAFIKKK